MGVDSCSRARGDRHPPALLMNNPLRGLFEKRRRFDSLIRPGDTVADLGCGSGYYTTRFSSLVGGRGLVFAVDTNRKAIDSLSKWLARSGVQNVKTSTSSTADLSIIPEGSVDFVLSNLTLCCMADHERAVDEMFRIMKVGGRAFVSITTIGRRSDPRTMTLEEFELMKKRFLVLDSRNGRTVAYALLGKGSAYSFADAGDAQLLNMNSS